MKKVYAAPMTGVYELELQSFLAASTQLQFTNEEADQNFEVLSNSKDESRSRLWE